MRRRRSAPTAAPASRRADDRPAAAPTTADRRGQPTTAAAASQLPPAAAPTDCRGRPGRGAGRSTGRCPWPSPSPAHRSRSWLWSHFVPAYDEWLDKLRQRLGQQEQGRGQGRPHPQRRHPGPPGRRGLGRRRPRPVRVPGRAPGRHLQGQTGRPDRRRQRGRQEVRRLDRHGQDVRRGRRQVDGDDDYAILQPHLYRKDYFQEVGDDKFPDDYPTLLEASRQAEGEGPSVRPAAGQLQRRQPQLAVGAVLVRRHRDSRRTARR